MSKYKARIAQLADFIEWRRVRVGGVQGSVFVHCDHPEELKIPNPTEAEMDECTARGVPIVHIHFVPPPAERKPAPTSAEMDGVVVDHRSPEERPENEWDLL